SLQDNILFGRVAHGRAQAREIIGRATTEVLDALGLRKTVIEIGLDYQVGVGGKRLSAVQRQKLGLARALLKQPDLLVVNEAVAVMDGATQVRLLEKILDYRQGRGVVWTLQRPSLAQKFQRLVVLDSGRVVEEGDFADLDNPGSVFTRLMAAE
ncbi:MAG TPA: ABC transporter ATP-binding protein, partial [Kiloniellaceae bacterium]|nr:ABC transporter ATP-binding protein [Kiloniellaceae bacterium]